MTTADETVELVETAEALTAWERVLQQMYGTLEPGAAREWFGARIRATRRAALGVQVELLKPAVTRPHVLRAASAERPDSMAEEANEQWTEAESREAWGK